MIGGMQIYFLIGASFITNTIIISSRLTPVGMRQHFVLG